MEDKVFFCLESKIVSNVPLAEKRFLLRVEAPEIAQRALPGQFVQIKLGYYDPFLPRPFAISLSRENWIEILYEIRGRGTQILSQARKGNTVNLFGPLGRGFFLPKDKSKKIVLIAGGMGFASLRFLAWTTWKKNYSSILLYGDRDKRRCLPLSDLLPKNFPYNFLLERGKGKTGFVTDLLKDSVINFGTAFFFVCGPRAMMKEVWFSLFKEGQNQAQFSFEERMSCGYGSCQGCAVLTKNDYQRVCKDGPVFRGEEIEWELI